MTNELKFKTPAERRVAYTQYCGRCKHDAIAIMDEFTWLDMVYEIELKPCPFCGGKAKVASGIHEGGKYHWVECTECYGRSVGNSLEDEAISAWNRRAT